MAARQAYSVKKLAPYTIKETVYTPLKDGNGKHTGFDRKEVTRTIKDGRMVMFLSGHSVRIEGGDEAVNRLLAKNDPLFRAEAQKQQLLTPEQAVERVLSRTNIATQEAE